MERVRTNKKDRHNHRLSYMIYILAHNDKHLPTLSRGNCTLFWLKTSRCVEVQY